MQNIAQTPLEYLICGSFGGFLATLVGHPFDTIKLRQQTTSTGTESTFDILHKLIVNEGYCALYKGLLSPLLTAVPSNAIVFASYKVAKMQLTSDDHEHTTARDYFIAGCFSGAVAGILATPGERIKCLLQMQGQQPQKEYNSVFDVIKKLYRKGGIRSIYRGLGATMLKETPAGGAYFMTYETIRDEFTEDGTLPTTNGIAMFSGGTAGLMYAIVGLPMDVIKTHVQTAPENEYPRGVRDAVPHLFRVQGVRGFTRGMMPFLMRAIPANSACFLGFELLRNYIRSQPITIMDYEDYLWWWWS